VSVWALVSFPFGVLPGEVIWRRDLGVVGVIVVFVAVVFVDKGLEGMTVERLDVDAREPSSVCWSRELDTLDWREWEEEEENSEEALSGCCVFERGPLEALVERERDRE